LGSLFFNTTRWLVADPPDLQGRSSTHNINTVLQTACEMHRCGACEAVLMLQF
jgi:hypothetical protein